MSGDRMNLAKEGAKIAADSLGDDDLLEVIAFDTNPIVYVPLRSARDRVHNREDIAKIQPGGGTEFVGAIERAVADLATAYDARRHVILLTDGQAPLQGLREIVARLRANDGTLSTIGVGEADEKTLRMLASIGGGRAYFVPDPSQLADAFRRELAIVRK
jgi:uncharacterized protein with von Willebrand factor type A (vWA) domain